MSRICARRLPIVAGALLLAGCGLIAKSVPILDARVSQDGLRLEVSVASCNADLSFEMQEDETSVALWVTARNDTSDDCADGLVVELERPLGGRILIDGHDFTEVEIGFSG